MSVYQEAIPGAQAVLKVLLPTLRPYFSLSICVFMTSLLEAKSGIERLTPTFRAEVVKRLLAVGCKRRGGALGLFDQGRQGGALCRLVPEPQLIVNLHRNKSSAADQSTPPGGNIASLGHLSLLSASQTPCYMLKKAPRSGCEVSNQERDRSLVWTPESKVSGH